MTNAASTKLTNKALTPPAVAKQPAAPQHAAAAPPVRVIARWLETKSSMVSRHHLHLTTDAAGARAAVLDELRECRLAGAPRLDQAEHAL